jgi:hypothetical protein
MSFRLFSLSGVAFALLVLVFAAGCGAPVDAPNLGGVTEEPPLAVPLAELFEQNAKNPAAVAKRYGGRVIETEAYLGSVRSFSDETRVQLHAAKDGGRPSGRWVTACFRPSHAGALARCDAGSRVRVRLVLPARPDDRLEGRGISIEPAGK